MNFYERLEFILGQRGLKPYTLVNGIGLSQSTIYTWKKTGVSPSLELCSSIADYLEITLDELAGRKTPQLSKRELELLRLYSGLSDEDKDTVDGLALFLFSKR